MFAAFPTSPRGRLWRLVKGGLCLAAVLVPQAVRAQYVANAYSNVSNRHAKFRQDRATDANGFTSMAADDITVAPGQAGKTVTGFQFGLANLQSVDVIASPVINIYAADGAGGGPGTLLFSKVFDAMTISSAYPGESVYTYNPQTALFVIPSNGTFWAGELFTNTTPGATATTDQLNHLGEIVGNPPTLGSSADRYFQTNVGGAFQSDNPAGFFTSFGNFLPTLDATANFEFSFSTTPAAVGTSAAPEPGSLVLTAFGLLAVTMASPKRRTKRPRCS